MENENKHHELSSTKPILKLTRDQISRHKSTESQRILSTQLSLVSIWTFFAFRCSFWFFVPTKSHNEQCDAQMETSTKNQNEQQKAITSNKRHLPVLVFEIELILSQKQERATKSSKRQRTANGNTHQKPKRATKSNKEHFSFPFSFIRTSSGPVEGGLYQEQ